MEYKPSANRRVREVLEQIFNRMDGEEKRKRPRPQSVEGPRSEFLRKYKLEGYEVAKASINSKFEKEVYNDETLKKWIEENEQ